MKILFRTDASIEIGNGHLMRCLTLADQLRSEGAEVAFVCRDLPGGMFDLLHTRGYQFSKLPLDGAGKSSQQFDAEQAIKAAEQLFPEGVDWLVVDHYQLDAVWERGLRPHTDKLMVIDDLANRQHDCNLLLDQNYYQDMERRYQGLVPDECVTLLGPEYVLLRPEFTVARQKLRARDGSVRRILIFFGGSDPENLTLKAIEATQRLKRPDIIVDVVVGTSNPHRAEIRGRCERMPNTAYYCQVANMAELMGRADLALGAGGATMWERCFLGLPSITVVFAANQEKATIDVAAEEAIKYIGWARQLEVQDYVDAMRWMILSPDKMREMGDNAQRLMGGNVSAGALVVTTSLLDGDNAESII
ncbi:MAG: UDP-2,4-diacetamido-2,4,6-trideoxy-beta-L-altropyranose hydrolase [Planctomycetaceae bacterium]|jgi:UDP-2,4-diacetamido-2,4,6-trideoxy-beta-L-altropyranose hydrolase|nr:UDP-2,4-diacetamido-2,4,6-trideoxy-beta-L-altropyranose hydrolase [Planctomycetaceae bacterium]